MGSESLKSYLAKRDFDRTPEPSGAKTAKQTDRPVFVVQEHDASSHHFDFRLEVDGVLVSWAVPKGPSLDPRDKRLAVRTEDHPLDYRDFEGVIPEDEYGGGTVSVWDGGPYRNLMAEKDAPLSMAESLETGHIEVWLDGEKLTGGFVLIHAKMGGDEKNWLLKKLDDDTADARRKPARTQMKSVLSGRTIAEITDDEA
tara:strand:+ start:5513 stop:6109 length:597 start_codon:yes stop_codon:yes gene_type:complete